MDLKFIAYNAEHTSCEMDYGHVSFHYRTSMMQSFLLCQMFYNDCTDCSHTDDINGIE